MALRAHDLEHGVVVVATGGVDGHTSGFINDNQIVIFVDNTNLFPGDGGFVTVQGMRDDLAVLDNGVGTSRRAVDGDEAIL